MARVPNHEHVRRTLAAIAILRDEPGWHRVDTLAARVSAQPDRLADDLRRVHYTAGYESVPIVFGDDLEPAHAEGPTVVQHLRGMPLELPLPASRVGLTRLALVVESALRREPFDEHATTWQALHDRLRALLDIDGVIDAPSPSVPPNVLALRTAIEDGRQVVFDYLALDGGDPSTRALVPERLWSARPGWLVAGHDLDRGAERVFRVDRILGEVTVGPVTATATVTGSGPGSGPGSPGPGSAGSGPVSRPVRLRIEEADLWAVEHLGPHGSRPAGAGRVDITVELFEPAGARLTRLLFLLRPGFEVLEAADDLLDAYRRQVAALRARYGGS